MEKYDPKYIEKKWQDFWQQQGTFEVQEDAQKEKFYGLVEFPYPSGAGLHVGHPRPFTAMDVISRKKRMDGMNVLFPMGFDAFGLPTENYAIKTGRPPKEVTEENIANFTRQLKSLGFSFDWSRAVDTTDPKYYKWTQWIFLKLFEHGLAYKKAMPINWCLSCKIGLANEEVVDGRCERCGGEVEKRNKEQWMLAITKYADSLLEGLNDVDYINRARVQQENWIGRSEGLIFTSPVKDTDFSIETFSAHFEAFCADTFVVIAPDHHFLSELLDGMENKEELLLKAKDLVQKRTQNPYQEAGDVEGFFTGRYTVDPVGNGELPIWVASYALAEYGTGIVKCSAHDERDFAFAKKYNILLKPTLFPVDEKEKQAVANQDVCFTDMTHGVLTEPAAFSGKVAGDHREAIADYAVTQGFAKREVKYKLRDWVFSRQRYWGEPIPLVNCEKCGWVPLPEDQLPLELPHVEKYEPTDTGESPLAAMTDWVNTTCPKCDGPAKRETDTMPNWAGSSWYFLRYCDPNNDTALASKESLEYWTPVDWYNGGMEHTVLHLLYSRFWNQFLFDIDVIPAKEPYKKRTSHGMILAKGGEKMSKSKGNVVNPDEMVEQFGADALRTYIMFMGPFDQAVEWDVNGLIGVKRFLDRVWSYYSVHLVEAWRKVPDNMDREESSNIRVNSLLHKTIKEVGEDIEHMKFNTAIAKLMTFRNALTQEYNLEEANIQIPDAEVVDVSKSQDCLTRKQFENFIKILSPFAPHMCEELWQQLGHEQSIAYEQWPTYDESKMVEDTIELVVQVNGKVRAKVEVPTDISEDDAKAKALEQENVIKWLEGKEPKKVIYVKGKLVSIVV